MSLPAPITIGLAALTSAVAIATSAFLSPTIDRQRVDQQLIFTNSVATGLPPQYAIFQAGAGIFRGIAINVLWQRATQMKDEGKFFEAMQLADWITTLQPRFPQVWEFNSWNLAYNMSVATQTPQERWNWVRKGIDLLQQKGIPNNPRSLRLYRQLSWIYLHKVGDLLDDMHMYYKTQIAAEWHAFLGPPPDGSAQAVALWFKPVVDAPLTQEQLLAQSPELAPIVDQLTSRGFKLDRDWVMTYGIQRAQASANLLYKTPPPLRTGNASPIPDNASQKQIDQLLAFARAKGLRDFYFMDPAAMLLIMQTKGPFDWRAPASHAFYWSYMGLVMTDDTLKAKPDPNADQVNTDRMTIFAMQQLTSRGRIIFEPANGYLNFLPDPRFIPAYERVFDAVASNNRETAQDDLDTGRQNFLEAAVNIHYFFGDMKEAQRYYEKLRLQYSKKAFTRYIVPLEEFVVGNFKEFVDGPDEGRQFLTGMIQQAITVGYLNNQPDVAGRFMENARKYHEFYLKSITDGVNPEKKREVKPFEETVGDVVVSILLDPERLDPVDKSRVWRQLPSGIQRRVWPMVRQTLLAQGEAAGLNNDVAFPTPAGMTTAPQTNSPQINPSPSTVPPMLRR